MFIRILDGTAVRAAFQTDRVREVVGLEVRGGDRGNGHFVASRPGLNTTPVWSTSWPRFCADSQRGPGFGSLPHHRKIKYLLLDLARLDGWCVTFASLQRKPSLEPRSASRFQARNSGARGTAQVPRHPVRQSRAGNVHPTSVRAFERSSVAATLAPIPCAVTMSGSEPKVVPAVVSMDCCRNPRLDNFRSTIRPSIAG